MGEEGDPQGFPKQDLGEKKTRKHKRRGITRGKKKNSRRRKNRMGLTIITNKKVVERRKKAGGKRLHLGKGGVACSNGITFSIHSKHQERGKTTNSSGKFNR